jgi:Phage integrase family
MRRNGQYLFRRQDVDLDRGVITIPAANMESRATFKSTPLRGRRSLSFANHPATTSLRLYCRFQDATWKVKLANFRWHDLRYTLASRLARANVPLVAIKELLGHKSIQTTVRFAFERCTPLGIRGAPGESNWHHNRHRRISEEKTEGEKTT